MIGFGSENHELQDAVPFGHAESQFEALLAVLSRYGGYAALAATVAALGWLIIS